jgi:transposase-like protein
MPAPLDPDKRAAILADIQAENPQRNEIARRHSVSPSTVTKIAREEKLGGAFDRSQTQQAARARKFDAKAARQQLVQDLLEDAQRLRTERIWAEYTQIVTGPAGAEFVTTKFPPLRDQQAGFTSVAICIDKAAKLTEQDSGDGSAGARSLLGRLGEALQVAAGQFDAEAADGVVNKRHPRD